MPTSHVKWPDSLIGGRLKEARLARDLTRKEAATLLNDSYNHLKMLELGRVQLSAVWLKRYAALYRRTLDFFVQDI